MCWLPPKLSVRNLVCALVFNQAGCFDSITYCDGGKFESKFSFKRIHGQNWLEVMWIDRGVEGGSFYLSMPVGALFAQLFYGSHEVFSVTLYFFENVLVWAINSCVSFLLYLEWFQTWILSNFLRMIWRTKRRNLFEFPPKNDPTLRFCQINVRVQKNHPTHWQLYIFETCSFSVSWMQKTQADILLEVLRILF